VDEREVVCVRCELHSVVKVGFGTRGNIQILWRCNREKSLTI